MSENKQYIYFFDDFNDIRRYKEGTDNDFAEVISTLDLIEDANKLSEENKELKKTVSYFAEVCACSIEVMNEDENLKKVHSAIICTEMQELLKENKELKNEIKMLKTIIGKNEYYIGNITHKGKWR